MFDFGRPYSPYNGDSFYQHLNDKIGNVFKIGMTGYKVVNIQKKSITFKNLSTGKNKLCTKP